MATLFTDIHKFGPHTDLFKALHENLNEEMLEQLKYEGHIDYEDELDAEFTDEVNEKINKIRDTFVASMYNSLMTGENKEVVISRIVVKPNIIELIVTTL